jgi:hypothetical protein
LLRAAVTIGVLALVLRLVPLETLLEGARRVPPALWLAVLGGFLLGHLVSAGKWRLLLAASGAHPRAPMVVRAHGAALFANLCLPSIVGGDLVRAGLVIQDGSPAGAVAVGGLADRVLDTGALTLVAALGGILAPRVLEGPAALVLAAGAAACLAAIVGVVVFARVGHPERLPGPLARLAGPLAKVRVAAQGLAGRPGAAVVALLLALGVQGAFACANAVLGGAVGIDLPLAAWLLAWPLAKIVALLPISLGGIGVREAALAGLLLPFGVDPALAVAESLLWEAVLVAGGLVAGTASLAIGFATRGPRPLASGGRA